MFREARIWGPVSKGEMSFHLLLGHFVLSLCEGTKIMTRCLSPAPSLLESQKGFSDFNELSLPAHPPARRGLRASTHRWEKRGHGLAQGHTAI